MLVKLMKHLKFFPPRLPLPIKIDSTRIGFQLLALLAVVGGLTLVLGDRQKETTLQKTTTS